MGLTLIQEIAATDGASLSGGTEAPGAPAVGRDLGELAGLARAALTVADDPVPVIAASDALIDFTRPDATVAHAEIAAKTATAMVIGTTGMDESQVERIRAAATRIPIVMAANMSVGVTLLAALTRRAAALLDDDYDIEIVEMHHRHKIDAPSGTALALGRAAAQGRKIDLETRTAEGRVGRTGPRKKGDIGFAVLRGGDVVGDHTVVFAADGERLELTHKASNRRVFARGAVRAALWAGGRAPGLYSMDDVLGLSSV